jgi:hypothetical protein
MNHWSALQLEEKGFSCFAKGKKRKKRKVSHNLCMKIYGKGCCLVKINIHMTSKGIYFVVWNIQVIDLNQRQTWKAKTPSPSPHKPPKIQDLHVLWGGVIDVVRWFETLKCHQPSAFEPPLQERFSKSSICTISAIVRRLASLSNYQFS